MGTLGDKFRFLGRPGIAKGQRIDPASVPKPIPVPYADFSGGLNLSAPPESIELNEGCEADDIELSLNGSLQRAPGHALIQTMPHTPDGIFLHGSTDGFSKVYLLAAPYVGIMPDPVSAPTWTNVGLVAKSIYPWAGLSVLGKLLVSNGSTYTGVFDFTSAGVTDISAQVIARAFGSAFGRVFAGGTATDALVVYWNDASGDPTAWTGLGSGGEILIPNVGTADSIVAIQGIGDNLLAVLCRNSIWLARETGVSDRPADFKEQYKGIGAHNLESVAAFSDGVIFLSERGIAVLTAGGLEIVSGRINNELLPVQTAGRYSGIYDPGLHRYTLSHNIVPTTWIYDLPIEGVRRGRFFKRTSGAEFLLSFPQTLGLSTGTIKYLVLAVNPSNVAELYQESYPSELYYGQPRSPIWKTYYASKSRVTDVVTTVGFEVEYSTTGASQITLTVPDTNGDFSSPLVVDLPDTSNKIRRALVDNVVVGMGIACEIAIVSGPVKVVRVTQLVQAESEGLLRV